MDGNDEEAVSSLVCLKVIEGKKKFVVEYISSRKQQKGEHAALNGEGRCFCCHLLTARDKRKRDLKRKHTHTHKPIRWQIKMKWVSNKNLFIGGSWVVQLIKKTVMSQLQVGFFSPGLVFVDYACSLCMCVGCVGNQASLHNWFY